jgi:hypothetical protein
LQKTSPLMAALKVTIVIYIAVNILLTPLGGYTSSPATNAREASWGVLAVTLLFLCIVLSTVSLLLMRHWPRWAAALAGTGAALYYPALLADSVGPFSTQEPPRYIFLLEAGQTWVALVLAFLALIVLVDITATKSEA